MNLYFTTWNSRLFWSVQDANDSQNVLKLNMQRRRSIPNGNTSSTFRRRRRTWSFLVVVLRRTAKKCTNNYNARAQQLFYSITLSLLFGIYIHTYNLYLYTIKDVKANKLVGSCTNKIHKITTIYRLIINTVNKKLIQELSNSYKKYNFDNNEWDQ